LRIENVRRVAEEFGESLAVIAVADDVIPRFGRRVARYALKGTASASDCELIGHDLQKSLGAGGPLGADCA
jgi:hypothetical protein